MGTTRLIQSGGDPETAVEELTEIVEAMRMHETCYTPEQLAQLEARREEVGEDQIYGRTLVRGKPRLLPDRSLS